MKKFAISLLVLALAFGVAANAAIGVRANITGATGVATAVANYLVLGMNNIDVLFGYQSKDKDLVGGANGSSNLAIGVSYYFAKLGDVKVGAHGVYASVAPGGATTDAASSIKVGLDLNAELAKGLSVGVTAVVFETNGGKTGGTDNKGSSMGLFSGYSVYAQVLAF